MVEDKLETEHIYDNYSKGTIINIHAGSGKPITKETRCRKDMIFA